MSETKTAPKIILLVDDEPSVLKVIKSMLEFEGYAVLTEKTGEAALETVRNTRLMAVLLDLGLQGMGGFDVLKQIKQIHSALPVIIVTGSHDEIEARRCFELGAWDYITKPIDFQYLKNALLFEPH